MAGPEDGRAKGKHPRAYDLAVKSVKQGHQFQARTAKQRKKRFSDAVEKKGGSSVPLTVRACSMHVLACFLSFSFCSFHGHLKTDTLRRGEPL